VRFDYWEKSGKRKIPRGRAASDPYVVAAASTYEQADLLFNAARSIIAEGPLADFFETFDKEIQRREGSGVLVRVPAVAGANDGLRPTFVVFDETHEWVGNRKRVALVLENGLSKRADAWSLSITTAGNPKADSVARQQYEYGVRIRSGELDDNSYLFVWKEPEIRLDELDDEEKLRAALIEANPEPWKRIDDLMMRYSELPLHDFARYYLNKWVEPDEERWLPPGAWQALADPRDVPRGTKVVLGFDGSYSGDSTALVAATVEDHPHLFVLGLWEHPGGSAAWTVDHDAVEVAVRDAFRAFEVVEMSADPPYWSQQLDRWMREYGEDRVIAFNTAVRKRMSKACSAFYAAVTTQQVSHDEHPGLARHIDNAVLRETADGAYITKDSKSSPRKIDAGIAAVIAYTRAMWHHTNPTQPVRAGVMFV
jgi:phage terminase large subunit-like protein